MSTKKKKEIRKRGYPLPGGVTLLKEGINFSVFARNATRVTLVVDHVPQGKTKPIRHQFELDPKDNRTGDMWHILLLTHQKNFNYGYRIDGQQKVNSTKKTYNYDTILIDPYCRNLLPRKWGEPAEYGRKPCCRLTDTDFDWENDRPLNTPLSETIIYELHVRGFTQDSSSNVEHPGTYQAIIEKIPYLKKLGITAVELMPVTEFDENDNIFINPDTSKALKNYWGYNPVSFFALNSGYASDPVHAVNEFKAMVLALHQAGIEVILDMVYNHTGEGGYQGATSSFRGLDNDIYYLLNKNGDYLNFSGCGNTMNCNHPVVRDLIRESLRYWVTEMHIDGFRFDLASILGRDRQGNVLTNPPMIEVIGEDPVLRDTKMIAEAWDAAGLYQVGSFSHDARWGEWNGKYRDDIRAFMTGKEGMVSHLATRIAGSSDLYKSSGRNPLCSINLITSHDGFTLYDLVSYNEKHNRLNGEDNRDGDNHNLSWNSGHEGADCPPEIQRLRLRRMKSMVALLFLSQGVPMLLAGDEFCRTQRGNNNAWCQDNKISWIDWNLLKKNEDFFSFTSNCIELRKQHPIFRREEFFLPKGQLHNPENLEKIAWQYLKPGEENWNSDCHGLGFHLYSHQEETEACEFFAMINNSAQEPLRFTLPKPHNGDNKWLRVIDSAATPPKDFYTNRRGPMEQSGSQIEILPFGILVVQT